MKDRIISCKKCKKKLFYLPSGYDMGVKVLCVDCHEKKPKSTGKKPVQNSYMRMRKGVREDIHPKYSFRSATEANFARILESLKFKWKYEERAFTFDHFGYKTKPYVYVMDFEIVKGNQDFPSGFYEIKGYMTPQSRQKLRRLMKCYPDEAARTTVVVYNKYKKKDIEFCKNLGYRYMLFDALTEKFKPQIATWE